MLITSLETPRTDPASRHEMHPPAVAPAWFDRLQRGALALTTVTVGLAAGFFFTYQISVTRGLAEVSDAAYVEAFQAINATIRNVWFGLVFFGAIPLLCATAALHFHTGIRTRQLVVAALVLYAITFAITAAGSVPLNNELALVTDRSPSALAAARADYEGSWNLLNLIRTLTCIGSLAALAAVRSVGRSATVQRENT